jgi:hypothetical protein
VQGSAGVFLVVKLFIIIGVQGFQGDTTPPCGSTAQSPSRRRLHSDRRPEFDSNLSQEAG